MTWTPRMSREAAGEETLTLGRARGGYRAGVDALALPGGHVARGAPATAHMTAHGTLAR